MEPVNIRQIQMQNQIANDVRAQNARPDAEEPAKKTAEESRVSAEDTAAKGTFGEVLDISEDGDTVTARPEALQKLDDGIVMLRNEDDESVQESLTEKTMEAAEKREELAEKLEAKAEAASEKRAEAREAAEKAAESKAAENTKEINSLTGYTDDMIETLYRQGKIDRSDYSSELDRRARLDEQLSPDEDTQDEQVQNNEAFSREMTTLNARAQEDERESEAIMKAAENGRTDLIMDIFGNTSDQ